MMATVPEGFAPLTLPGEFVSINGPLYVCERGGKVQLGFRVERRHTNPMGICHGGMTASFCDMLLPIGALRQRPEIGPRFLPTVNLQIDYLAPAPLDSWPRTQRRASDRYACRTKNTNPSSIPCAGLQRS